MLFQVIASLYRIMIRELRELRFALTVVLITTLVGSLFLLVLKPSIGMCMWIIVIPWFFSGWHLFSAERYIKYHLTGEMLEVLQVPVMSPEGPKPTNVLENEFVKTYRQLIFGIFFFQTSLFLSLPLYVNYTMGGATEMIIIVMISTLIAIASVKVFMNMFKFMAISIAIAYMVGLVFHLIPQISLVSLHLPIPSRGTSSEIREINELRSKQQEETYKILLDRAREWKRVNPEKEWEPRHLAVMKAAAKNMPLEEFYRRINNGLPI